MVCYQAVLWGDNLVMTPHGKQPKTGTTCRRLTIAAMRRKSNKIGAFLLKIEQKKPISDGDRQGWGSTPAPQEGDLGAVQRRFTHRGFLGMV